MATDEYLYHRRLIIGLTTVILMLAVASYALRLYARRISGARIWLDDCVIGVGLVSFELGPSLCVIELELEAYMTRSFSVVYPVFATMLVCGPYRSSLGHTWVSLNTYMLRSPVWVWETCGRSQCSRSGNLPEGTHY